MAAKPGLSDLTVRDIQARLPGLLIFESVARHKNFSRAADDFMVTPTAISKAIKLLEEQMNVRLFNRTTRSTALTEAGQTLFEALRPALDQIKASLESVSDAAEQPYGLLRLNASYVGYATLVEPHLEAFLTKYPDIKFEISLDHTLSDIVASGFDAGIRLGHALQKDMISVRLGPTQSIVVAASPNYIAKYGAPTKPQDLLEHRCIRQRYATQGKFFEWTFQSEGKSFVTDVDGPLVVDEMRLAATAARNGAGVGYLFRQFVEDDLISGRLEVVLEQFSPKLDTFHIYYPGNRLLPGKLRVFIDHMRAANADVPR